MKIMAIKCFAQYIIKNYTLCRATLHFGDICIKLTGVTLHDKYNEVNVHSMNCYRWLRMELVNIVKILNKNCFIFCANNQV